MAKRPPGRPRATQPKDVKVTVRLSEHEADQLCRLAREGTLSKAIRSCIHYYISSTALFKATNQLPDTPTALIHRELRKAKRATTHPAAAELMQAFVLEEPADAAPGDDKPVDLGPCKDLFKGL